MKTFLVLAVALLATSAHAKGQEVSFETADGITVYGDIYTTPDLPKSAPLILLFHQGGGDARGEYLPLVSRLVAEGYNLLAIDQRRGGDRFGMENRTLAGIQDEDYSYCDVYPDLEAALQYALDSGFTGKIAAWGSSYSAALVFQLADNYPDEIHAVLAFSPASGDPMAGCRPEKHSKNLSQPVLALRPSREAEIPSVIEQLQTFAEHGHQTYVTDPGTHGSSMLNPERVDGPTEATWHVVLDFLSRAFAAD